MSRPRPRSPVSAFPNWNVGPSSATATSSATSGPSMQSTSQELRVHRNERRGSGAGIGRLRNESSRQHSRRDPRDDARARGDTSIDRCPHRACSRADHGLGRRGRAVELSRMGQLSSARSSPLRRHDRDLRASLDGTTQYDEYTCPVTSCSRLVPGLFDVRFIEGPVDFRPHLACAWCLAALRSAESDGQIFALEVLGHRGQPLAHVLSGTA